MVGVDSADNYKWANGAQGICVRGCYTLTPEMQEPAKSDMQAAALPDRAAIESPDTREPTWQEFEINTREPGAVRRDQMDDLFRRAADGVRELSQGVQAFCTTGDRENRQTLIVQLNGQIRGLQGIFAAANLEMLSTFCSALARLTTSLSENFARVNLSTLRTLSNGVDFLRAAVWPAFYRRQNEGQPIHVLVVDDNVVCRVALLMALNARCLTLTSANCGEEALQRASKTRFDVIFSDIMMPELDGFDLAKRIHALPNHATTPIIFVTALSDFASRSKSILSGGSDLLGKPFTAAEVLVKAFTVGLTHRAKASPPGGRESPLAAKGVIHLDSKGHIQSINADVTRILGYAETDLLYWPLRLLMPDDLQRALKTTTVGRLLAGDFRNAAKTEMLARRKDQATVRVTLSVSETNENSKRGFVVLIQVSDARPKPASKQGTSN